MTSFVKTDEVKIAQDLKLLTDFIADVAIPRMKQ